MASNKIGAVMVVGGGISGMQSALDLADSGYRVYLVEKQPSIGVTMAQLDKTFLPNDCAMCIMAPKLVATGRHHNINLITNAEVAIVDGQAGNFTVTVKQKAFRVDSTKCTGCGSCAHKCPIEATNEYDEKDVFEGARQDVVHTRHAVSSWGAFVEDKLLAALALGAGFFEDLLALRETQNFFFHYGDIQLGRDRFEHGRLGFLA